MARDWSEPSVTFMRFRPINVSCLRYAGAWLGTVVRVVERVGIPLCPCVCRRLHQCVWPCFHTPKPEDLKSGLHPIGMPSTPCSLTATSARHNALHLKCLLLFIPFYDSRTYPHHLSDPNGQFNAMVRFTPSCPYVPSRASSRGCYWVNASSVSAPYLSLIQLHTTHCLLHVVR